MSKIQLYSYYRSSASFRVRIALALKNITYETIPVNLIKDGGEQFTNQYSEVNPMHQVPTINIDGVTLTQSISIIEYIDEAFNTGAKLLPTNVVDRAHARSIAEIINSGIQPLQNLQTLKAIGGDSMMWAHDVIRKGFQAIEKLLAKTAKTYCVGDEISIADICLVPQVYNANRFKVNMEQFPLISKVFHCLSLHKAIQAAAPNKQPDCPESERH